MTLKPERGRKPIFNDRYALRIKAFTEGLLDGCSLEDKIEVIERVLELYDVKKEEPLAIDTLKGRIRKA